jgi:hypothetical protein
MGRVLAESPQVVTDCSLPILGVLIDYLLFSVLFLQKYSETGVVGVHGATKDQELLYTQAEKEIDAVKNEL